MPRLAFAGPVQVPQRALEILDFALVIDLLPFGKFERFEHFFHLIERVFEFVDDSVHLLDGVRDALLLMRGFGRALVLALLGFFNGRLGRCRGRGGGRAGFARWRR
jgi:hypothetical protein